MNTYLETAVSILGTQTELARQIGVQQAHVWNWLNRSKGRVPAEYCIPIEKATGGQVTRYQLRPEVFGIAPAATE